MLFRFLRRLLLALANRLRPPADPYQRLVREAWATGRVRVRRPRR